MVDVGDMRFSAVNIAQIGHAIQRCSDFSYSCLHEEGQFFWRHDLV